MSLVRHRPRTCLEGMRKNTKVYSKGVLSLGSNSNRRTSKYEKRALITQFHYLADVNAKARDLCYIAGS